MHPLRRVVRRCVLLLCLFFSATAIGNQYLTTEQLQQSLRDIAASHPGITELVDAGDSLNKHNGNGGYDILALRITNRQIDGDKPVLLAVAGVHGNEWPGPDMLMLFAGLLTDSYGEDAEVSYLIDHHEIWLLPLLNPDGRALNRRRNIADVDLNRNFDFKWMARPPHGEAPESEPEVAALVDLVRHRQLFAHHRGAEDTDPASTETTGLFLDHHSPWHSNLYAWSWAATPPPNAQDLQRIADKFQMLNNYPFAGSWHPKFEKSYGTSQDWFYGTYGVPAFTLENPAKKPPYSTVLNSYWPAARAVLLYGVKLARRPYRLIHGPAIDNLHVSVTDDEFVISAYASDEQHGGQRITAAEAYIGSPPWRGGRRIDLGPADGIWSSSSETVTVRRSIQGLPPDSRLPLLVRAKDGDGNWGPFSATWLTLGDNQLPHILAQSPDSPVEFPVFGQRTFSVNAVDPDNDPLRYRWLLDRQPLAADGDSYRWQATAEQLGDHLLEVQISDSHSTLIRQWAVTIVQQSGMVIVDDQDANTRQSGHWPVSQGANPYQGGSLYSDSQGSFSWLPRIIEPGRYQVSAWWTTHDRRSSAVPFTIHDSVGSHVVTVDMQRPDLGGQWNPLGEFEFSTAGQYTITVSSANGQACADAVRLDRIGDTGDNLPPAIGQPPQAAPNPVMLPATSRLTVIADDPDGGPAPLSYSWRQVSGPGQAQFSDNNSSTANNITASFDLAGDYLLAVTVSDGSATTDSTLAVTVLPAPAGGTQIIVDDLDANTSLTGTWPSSSGSAPYRGHSRYSNDGAFSWLPELPEAGEYSVYAWWTSHPNRSTRVPYTIHDRHGAHQVWVDMRDPAGGGLWQWLGNFEFEAGNATIEVSADNGQAGADAIRLVGGPQAGNLPPVIVNDPDISVLPVIAGVAAELSVTATDPDNGPAPLSYQWSVIEGPAPVSFSANNSPDANIVNATFNLAGSYRLQVSVSDGDASVAAETTVAVQPLGGPAEIIIDNRDINTRQLGQWTVSTGASPYGADSLYSQGAASFDWVPAQRLKGRYALYAWWTYHPNRAGQVPYTLSNGALAATVHVNMQDPALAGRWQLLGVWDLDDTHDTLITVSGANGQACADAVRFVRQ